MHKRYAFYYGLLALPLAMLGLPLSIYLPTFYATLPGASMALVGAIIFVARLSDIVVDPYLGVLSDRYAKHQSGGVFGGRKGFIIIGLCISILSYWGLVQPPLAILGEDMGIYIWLFVMLVLVYLGWSFVSIAYLAWSSEISTDYHDKTIISGFREVFLIIGGILALLLPTMIVGSEDAKASLWVIFNAFLILTLITAPIMLTKTPFLGIQAGSYVDLKTIKDILLNSKSLKLLQGAFLINACANALPASLFLLYIDLVIGAGDWTGALLMVYFFAGVVGLPFWTKLSRHIGKATAWRYSMLWSCVIFAFVPWIGQGDEIAFAWICALSGLSLGADMALPSSLQADITNRQKQSVAGALFGFWAMLTKMALALAIAIGFIGLGVIGFDQSKPEASHLSALVVLYGILPVLLKIVSIYMMMHFKEEK